MSDGLTRRETIRLTGVSSGRLSRLDSTGLVSPQKSGNPKHPKVVYSWENILQIKILERLRGKLSSSKARLVLEYFEKRNYAPSLFQRNLVFINEQMYLIEDWQDFGLKVLEESSKNQGRISIHSVGDFGDLATDLQRRSHNVLDFGKKVKGTRHRVTHTLQNPRHSRRLQT